MNIYADYEYYRDVFGGKTVSEGDFPRLAAKASVYIDSITFGRAAEHKDDERLKRCCCELCDSLSAMTADSGGLIKQSESVGSWSVTYANAENTSETTIARAVCRMWLPAEWLCRGVSRE